MTEQQGFTLWLTGLSGSGKTTIARLVEHELLERGLQVERLDGDIVRESLTSDLGFSREDRETNIRRIAFVAKLLSRNGVAVIASFISPYQQMREQLRQETTNFIEVYVNASLDDCIKRDVKGHYRKALSGEIAHFTGISDPYEEPTAPEIEVKTGEQTPEESAQEILAFLIANDLIPPK